MTWKICLAVLLVASVGCTGAANAPVTLRAGEETCGTCRMVISDTRFASQIVWPDEEPRFFDDFGCLTNYLRTHSMSAAAHIYVVEHRAGAWIPAERAIFTSALAARAPMGSPVIAHGSVTSRDLDPDARGGSAVEPKAILRPAGGGP